MRVPTWLPLAVYLVLMASSLARVAGLRRVGVHAFAQRADDDAYGFLGRVFAILFTVTLVFCAVYAVWPGVAAGLGPLSWPGQDSIAWLGAALAVAGVILAAAAQFGMGRSWRLGVREDDTSELVVTGLYRFSRNPIYVGMLAAMVGIFLIAPNAVTLTIAIVAWVAVSTQMRLEEDFLARKHGSAYDSYRAQTRRWL